MFEVQEYIYIPDYCRDPDLEEYFPAGLARKFDTLEEAEAYAKKECQRRTPAPECTEYYTDPLREEKDGKIIWSFETTTERGWMCREDYIITKGK